MSYKKKMELEADTSVALGGKTAEGKTNPTQVEGYYIGFRTIDGNYGPKKLHIFNTAEGNVGVFSRGNLDRILTETHQGQMCLVKFVGMRGPFKKGQKPSYQYELQYDEENTIDVAGLSQTTATSDDQATSTKSSRASVEEDEGDDSDLFNDEETSLDEVVSSARPTSNRAPALKPAASNNQERVRALLAKSRNAAS